MANDISYSGTRQGTFMPKLVLFPASEIFYNISISFEIINQKGVQHTIKVSFHIYVHCTYAKIQAVEVL
jgi:hypothetical protein